jgi:hypothetical protein
MVRRAAARVNPVTRPMSGRNYTHTGTSFEDPCEKLKI